MIIKNIKTFLFTAFRIWLFNKQPLIRPYKKKSRLGGILYSIIEKIIPPPLSGYLYSS